MFSWRTTWTSPEDTSTCSKMEDKDEARRISTNAHLLSHAWAVTINTFRSNSKNVWSRLFVIRLHRLFLGVSGLFFCIQ